MNVLECCLFLAVAVLVNNISLVSTDLCSLNKTVTVAQYKQVKSYTSCGIFWWGRCARYRNTLERVSHSLTVMDCCDGYIGEECDQPTCFGNTTCANGGTCVSPDNCFCPIGYLGKHCDEEDYCVICDQICTRTHHSVVCSCHDGYRLEDDQKSCKAGADGMNVPGIQVNMIMVAVFFGLRLIL